MRSAARRGRGATPAQTPSLAGGGLQQKTVTKSVKTSLRGFLNPKGEHGKKEPSISMERHVPWDSAEQSLSIQRWKDNAGGATNSLTLRKPALLTETPTPHSA